MRSYTSATDTAPEAEAAASRLGRIRRLAVQVRADSPTPRNRVTRALDALFDLVATHARWAHTIGAAASAVTLFLYARLCAATARFASEAPPIPDAATPCILALWHACAPALLVAIAAHPPACRTVIMVTHGPRGDCLDYLCRMLGLEVVHGDSQHGGWAAITALADELARGARVIITVDGQGPARVVKPGAVALAAAADAPIVAVGAYCRPALVERHKWDHRRNPVPFARIALATSAPHHVPHLADAATLAAELRRLGDELEAVSIAARLDATGLALAQTRQGAPQ